MMRAIPDRRARGPRIWGIALGTIVVLALSSQVRAQETFEGRVTKLLEEGWGASIKSLAPAQEHFEAAEQLGGDHRAKLAMMLAFLKHRRYSEVDDLAAKLLENDPAMISAREARIWVQMLNKKYPAALVEMETLAKNLPETASPAEEENIVEAAQFLGRLIGYLEGPGGDTLGKNQAADHVKKIESLLVATGRREAFAEGRKRVADQHAGVALDSEQLKADEKEAEEKRKALERERLAKEKTNIGENKAEIEDLASKATRETTEGVAEIDKQMAPLNAQFARLSGEAQRVQLQIGNLNLELGRVLQIVDDNKKDPVQQAIWLREADRIRIVQGQYQSQYAALNAEAVRVNTQRAALDQQRRTKIANYEADMKRLGKQAQILSKTEKRINQDEKRAEKPATGNTLKVQSSNAKAAALSSYVDYPLERQRQRVLESFKPAKSPGTK
jgi:hypothetical protein